MASKHQTVKLEFAKREGTGKGTCRKLRSKDQLPVVLYGPEYKNGLAGVISARAVAPVANSAHRETTLIELDFADGGSATALSATYSATRLPAASSTSTSIRSSRDT